MGQSGLAEIVGYTEENRAEMDLPRQIPDHGLFWTISWVNIFPD
jgi:hypothetical protein